LEIPLAASAGESLTFRVAGHEDPVLVHTPETRAAARAKNPLLRLYTDDELTHYVEARLPSDAIALMSVTQRIEVNGSGCDAAVLLAIHVPREGRRADAAEAMRKGADAAQFHPKLALLDEGAAELAVQQPDVLYDVLSPFDTAAALLFQHPALINLSVENGGRIPSLILRQCIGEAIHQRSEIVNRIRRLGPKWSTYVPLEYGDGDEPAIPVFTMELHEDVRSALPDPLALALKASQELLELKNETWTVQYGITSREESNAATRENRPVLRDDETRWTKRALSSEWGVSFGDIEYTEPTLGGWTIEALWSSDSKPKPMDKEFVSALFAGTAFIRIDVESDPPADYRATIPGQADEPDTVARFRVDFPGARAVLSLDPQREDLTVLVMRNPEARSVTRLVDVRLGIVKNGTDEELRNVRGSETQRGELRMTAKNARLRHLSAYAEFFDTNGRAIEPGPLTSLPLGVFDRHATKRYVDCIGPVSVVFGVPLPPDPVTLRIPFPDNAAKMRLYWGGLGTGRYDAAVCPLGITATAIFELALPVFLLAAGSAIGDSRFVKQILEDKRALISVVGAGAHLISGYIGLAQNPALAAKQVAITLGPMVAKAAAKKGAEKFALWIARKIGEGAVRRAIPFVNVAFQVFDAAVTFAQLGQTVAAIVQSPFYYDFEITRSFDLHVKLEPDPDQGQFPTRRDRLRVQIVYDTGAELRHFETADVRDRVPIDHSFADCPAGGRMKVFVFFHANEWQSGRGSTEWFDARGENGTSRRQVEVTVVNEEIPLSPQSVYEHMQSTAFENGDRRWKHGPAPTETAERPDGSGLLQALNGVTIAQLPGMVGYAWQARGLGLPRDNPGQPVDEELHAVQTVSLPERPPRHAITPVGFRLQSAVSYELASANDGSGRSFFIDPSRGYFDPARNPGGGHHLRGIALSSGEPPRFEIASGRSWGRFPAAMDSLVFTQGYVAGVTSSASKLYILRLPDAPVPDAQATMASLASGEGTRDGLLSLPRAITVALDGRLLVLEEGNRRVQCFDFTGNPVPYFKSANGGAKSPVLPLRNAESTRFRDLAVEAKGYLFVLGSNGERPEDYRVDIYEPDGSFLVTTTGVAAGKIAVDLARSMYTLNWQILRGPNGRPEPSVSQWLPPVPGQIGEPS
jgi:hypothetical protein